MQRMPGDVPVRIDWLVYLATGRNITGKRRINPLLIAILLAKRIGPSGITDVDFLIILQRSAKYRLRYPS